MTPQEYLQTVASKPKPSKHRNVRTVVDGVQFDSMAEARRFSELKLLEKAGKISALELQPKFELRVEGQKICDYIGDFVYLDEHSRPVVEDVKSQHTRSLPVFRLKAKLFKACWGFDITLVGKGAA